MLRIEDLKSIVFRDRICWHFGFLFTPSIAIESIAMESIAIDGHFRIQSLSDKPLMSIFIWMEKAKNQLLFIKFFNN